MIAAGRRVLVLAPHTDDGEFGCGGSIARMVAAGAEVHYHAFSSASRSLPEGWPSDTLVTRASRDHGARHSGDHVAIHDFDGAPSRRRARRSSRSWSR